jgi:hypothetical protein
MQAKTDIMFIAIGTLKGRHRLMKFAAKKLLICERLNFLFVPALSHRKAYYSDSQFFRHRLNLYLHI